MGICSVFDIFFNVIVLNLLFLVVLVVPSLKSSCLNT